jgi:hypothetical protein
MSVFSEIPSQSDLMAERKLDDVLKELIPLSQQGKIAQFLNNAQNADKLGDLVEDIRDAMTEYQVSSQTVFYPTLPNSRIRHRCSKICLTRAASSS